MTMVHGHRIVLHSCGPVQGKWGGGWHKASGGKSHWQCRQVWVIWKAHHRLINRKEEAVEITVHNEGVALTEQDIPGLFELFGRGKSVEGGTQSGWGLGLTVVKGVVEAHNGQVRVESRERQGTSFILTLPRDPVPKVPGYE